MNVEQQEHELGTTRILAMSLEQQEHELGTTRTKLKRAVVRM
jgi:hypothetical protein